MLRVVWDGQRQRAAHAMLCLSQHPWPASHHQSGMATAAGSQRRPPQRRCHGPIYCPVLPPPSAAAVAASIIGRKINSRLSGRHRPSPSSPPLVPRRHRAWPRGPGIARQRMGSSSHLRQHPTGRSGKVGGRGRACPRCGAGMPEEMGGSGASRAPSIPGEGSSGLQHYVRIR